MSKPPAAPISATAAVPAANTPVTAAPNLPGAQQTHVAVPPAVLIGLQQPNGAPQPNSAAPNGALSAPRPFKSTTDPLAVSRKRAEALEATRKRDKESQMNLKRVEEQMGNVNADEKIEQRQDPNCHAPHCCGKLPKDCTCQSAAAPAPMPDGTAAAAGAPGQQEQVTINIDDPIEDVDELEPSAAPVPTADDQAQQKQLLRDASPAQ